MTKLCSRCNRNPAVVFITKMEAGKTTNEGLCLLCAKELGIAPLDEMMQQMGIKEEDIEGINEQMSEFMENIGDISNPEALGDMLGSLMPMGGGNDDDGDGENEGGAPTAPIGFLNNLFGGSGAVPFQSGKDKDKSGSKSNKPKSKKKSMLDTYGTNLTAKAALGQVDRVVNRSEEIDRVIQILNRRSKNNPVLLGEPGVGKTAIAEGLACRIFEKNVPPKLFGYQLYLLDFTAIVAGTQFRGQFEARLKTLLEEAQNMGNVILIIDEIHNIVAAGDAEGAMSAANILKPALARGEIQIIGATTLSEYRKHIEKDSALERRFQPVLVDEPSVAESIEILQGIKDYYEKYHRVKISDKVLEQAVRMSERYITDRFLPDKAIDLMDEACANMAMHSPIINEIASLGEEIKKLRTELSALEGKETPEEEDFRKIADLKTALLQKEARFDELSRERDGLCLTDEEIARVIEVWTGIPATNISENEFVKIERLEDEIKKRIVGQDEAVKAVSKAIKRSRAGISYKKKPVSFIFAGSTGVGKTELVKVLARYLFDSPEALIRLDMSEFMEKHSVSRIIGSPPGYVGYDDAGQLTEKIRRKPYTVILFDEIEKAHPDVMNILLQILDDGRITDAHGKEVNFENTVIIMTTNAGSSEGSSVAGFGESASSNERARVMKALEAFLRPEFINRVDEIIVFNRLTKESFKAICRIMLSDLQGVLAEKGMSFDFSDALVAHLAEKGYSEKYGARNLRRLIQTDIEDELANEIVANYREPITKIFADAKDGTIIIKTEK